MTPRSISRLRSTSAVAVVFISALLLPGMLAAPASAATPAKKLFAANISPPSVAGCSMPYTFTLKLLNETKTQVIDAANLTAPSGFTLLAIDSLTSDAKKPRATISGTMILLRGLGLLPAHTATLVFDAIPTCEAGPYAWLIDVRQSNDFGGAGNIVGMDVANSAMTTGVGDVVKCPASEPCSGFVKSDTTTADVAVDPGSSDAILTVSLLPTDAIQCFEPNIEGPSIPYVGTSDTVQFDITATDRGKTVTITIPANLVGDRAAADFEVCYVSNGSFTDKFKNTIPAGSPGLLPDCTFIEELSGPDNPPCVLDRVFNEDGSFSISFFAPEGDPKGHT